MFFHISKTSQNNFPYNHQTKNLVVSLDEGWSHTVDQHYNDIWYKGYLDQDLLSDHVLDIAEEEEPKHNGNFCVIKVFDQGLVIRSDKLRSFPLWYDIDIGLTNLYQLKETYWTDSFVMLKNDLELIHSKFDVIGEIIDTKLTLDQVVDQVDALLIHKTKSFLSQLSNPIRVFLSGGIDTALIFSYIQKHTDNYEIILNSHIDYDYFYLKNHTHLKQLWGYNQIHHWNKDCVLSSGAPGDEFTARSPVTANLLLLHHGTSVPDLLNDAEFRHCLHYSYYNQQKYLDIWHETQKTYQHLSLAETIDLCCNYITNDWQHWHLGRTLTWTPLRDLEMFKLFARLEFSDLKQQVMNSVVQKKLIERNNPKILNYLSPQKNSNNYMKNLTNLLDN
jgi:hypothetical protein